MSKITINLDSEEIKILQKRAKKNLMTLREQIEDIIRRSCVTYKGHSGYKKIKTDDRLIEIFSREKRSTNRRRKKK